MHAGRKIKFVILDNYGWIIWLVCDKIEAPYMISFVLSNCTDSYTADVRRLGSDSGRNRRHAVQFGHCLFSSEWCNDSSEDSFSLG
jgi:hypothetical protein